MTKIYNFYAGPATLPRPVLEKARDELLDYNGTGMSIMEISHRSKDFDKVMENVLNFAAFTAPMNVAGAASMSVPLSWSSGGLPIGSMFSAKRGEDALLFELALQLEMARPWISRTPPVSAL